MAPFLALHFYYILEGGGRGLRFFGIRPENRVAVRSGQPSGSVVKAVLFDQPGGVPS
jgi:hypothetical protein